MKQFGVFCLWLRTLVVSDLRLTCQWLMALYTCRQRSPTEELFNKIQNECIKQEPGNVIIIRPSLKILTYIFDQKSLGHSSLEN
jgi:hypothetical protein